MINAPKLPITWAGQFVTDSTASTACAAARVEGSA